MSNALLKRLDRVQAAINKKAEEMPALRWEIRFVTPGKGATQIMCNGSIYDRQDDESEKAFEARVQRMMEIDLVL